MSVAGAIPVFICLILFLVQKENYDYIWGRRLLLAGLFFFLIPVQLVKYLLPEKILTNPMLSQQSQLYLSQSLTFMHENGSGFIWIPWWGSMLIILWAIAIILFAIIQFTKYRKGIRIILQSIDHTVENSNINLKYSVVPDGFCGPCTIGFFHQRIIIPDGFTEHPDFLMIYRHEQKHLKNHDNLVKLICLVILCLHWMNPAAYLLIFLYRITAEAVSDGAAIDYCSREEITRYAVMVVSGVPAKEVFPTVWKNNFSAEGKTIKRRISYIMRRKKSGMLQKGIMVALSALTVVVSAGTVLAYEPIQSADTSVNDVVFNDSLDFSSYDFGSSSLINQFDFSESDEVFMYEDGTQIPVRNSSGRAVCNHNMGNGYLSTHQSKSNGGCVVTVYTCQRCNKCGYLANAKYYNTVTYAKCPH